MFEYVASIAWTAGWLAWIHLAPFLLVQKPRVKPSLVARQARTVSESDCGLSVSCTVAVFG